MRHSLKKGLQGLGFGLALSLFLGTGVFAVYEAPPAPNAYILDEANLLPDDVEARLNQSLQDFDTAHSTQVVVVTLSSLQGYPIEEVALEIGRTWGVGQADLDNGLVFLIAPNERQARIEVGYGLEGAITDLQSAQIIDTLALPRFRESNYITGIVDSTEALLALAAGEEFDFPAQPSGLNSEGLIFAIWLILAFGWTLLSLMSQSKSWWLGGVLGSLAGAVVAALLSGTLIGFVVLGGILGLLLDLFLSTVLHKKIPPPSSRGGGFGGGGRGGSSGGFGGFGGGGFGGGGASGSW